MQGIGCLTVIIGFLLWSLFFSFMLMGFPAIALIAGVMIWRHDGGFGSFLSIFAGLLLVAGTQIHLDMRQGQTDTALAVFPIYGQFALLIVLLAYTLLSRERAVRPRKPGFSMAVFAAWTGAVTTLFIWAPMIWLRSHGG